MSTTVQRRALSDLVIATLVAGVAVNGGPCPVGDMVQPAGGGWAKPGSNAVGNQFVPYLVVFPGTGKPTDAGAIGAPQADWQFPYQVQSFGTTRDQCEWMADAARAALSVLQGTVINLGDAEYKIGYIKAESIGGVTRVPAVDPPYFGQSDMSTLWMFKQRS